MNWPVASPDGKSATAGEEGDCDGLADGRPDGDDDGKRSEDRSVQEELAVAMSGGIRGDPVGRIHLLATRSGTGRSVE
jgi:hypothetical protein